MQEISNQADNKALKYNVPKEVALKTLEFSGLPTTENSLDSFKGFIAHEMGHVVNNDNYWFLLNRILCAIGVHKGAKGIENFVSNRISNRIKADSFLRKPLIQNSANLGRGILRIPLSLINYALVGVVERPCRYYREYEADTFACEKINDPVVLRHMAELFENENSLVMAIIKRQFPSYESYVEQYPKLFFSLLFDSKHPDDISRAQRFEQAARRLEEKQTIREKEL